MTITCLINGPNARKTVDDLMLLFVLKLTIIDPLMLKPEGSPC